MKKLFIAVCFIFMTSVVFAEIKTGFLWLYTTQHRQDHYHTLRGDKLTEKVIIYVDAEGNLSAKIGSKLVKPGVISTLKENQWNHITVEQNKYTYTIFLNSSKVASVVMSRRGQNRKPRGGGDREPRK